MTFPFAGFQPEATAFFASLERNNSKPWFDKNRNTFEKTVKLPFAALIEELPAKLRPMKVFRLNRDIRFSADKSPYKLMHGAAHNRAGGTVQYMHIDKQGLLLAAGFYMMEPNQLTRFREKLMNKQGQASFKKLVSSLEKKGVALDPGGSPPVKSAPRGIDADHPMIQWLRWKGCVAMIRIIATELDDVHLPKRIVKWWNEVEPLNEWLES
jgi:uncharacterized protein (TIGR02453 family)